LSSRLRSPVSVVVTAGGPCPCSFLAVRLQCQRGFQPSSAALEGSIPLARRAVLSPRRRGRSITRERNGTKFTAAYKGKLDGDTIKRTIETERDGQKNSREWEAKRVNEEKK